MQTSTSTNSSLSTKGPYAKEELESSRNNRNRLSRAQMVRTSQSWKKTKLKRMRKSRSLISGITICMWFMMITITAQGCRLRPLIFRESPFPMSRFAKISKRSTLIRLWLLKNSPSWKMSTWPLSIPASTQMCWKACPIPWGKTIN